MVDGPFPALVAAVQQFNADKYSQGKRWQSGFSDCSSYVGKGMKVLGEDMGASTTLTYMTSPKWSTISRSQIGPGDIAVNATHMVVITGSDTAIGQENPRRNVQSGSIDDLMGGTGPYIFRRYKGGSNITYAGFNGPTAQQAGLLDIPGEITKAFSWMTNTTNWLRVGMVLGGAFLIYLTLIAMGKSEASGILGTAQEIGKKVSKSAKSTT